MTDNEKVERFLMEPYYVNQTYPVTKRGLIMGALAIPTLLIGQTVAFWFVRITTSPALREIPQNSPEWIKVGNDLNAMVNPDPVMIIVLSICAAFLVIPILSNIDIITQMNRWKIKYPSKSWDELLDKLRSEGMTYPWWQCDKFWANPEQGDNCKMGAKEE